MAVELPTYIPLAEAAKRCRLGRQALTRLVEDGRIRAAKINGDVVVAEEDVDVTAMQAEVRIDENLRGQPIRLTEASDRYKVSQTTLSTWADKGLISVIERRPRFLLLDEADVKLATEVFRQARKATGSYVRAGWVLKRVLGRS